MIKYEKKLEPFSGKSYLCSRKENDMALQLILGSSGCGKSHFIYERIIKSAIENPKKRYYIIVPEQFTMQTQKIMAEMHPRGGILNIDVLSFGRLAYRVLEETGGDTRTLLEETGKSLVLQKLVQEKRKELPYLGSQMGRPGYIAQMKSVISELLQYGISTDTFKQMTRDAKDKNLLYHKMADVQVLYEAFREYLGETYMTAEEILDLLCTRIEQSVKIADSVAVFDGFTGFTPIQNRLVQKMLKLCEKVYVTVTIGSEAKIDGGKSPYQLFSMSRKMIRTLKSLTDKVEEDIRLYPGEHSRFEKAPALQFLEQWVFRYRTEVYEKEQKEIQIYCADNPQKEMELTASKILRLVREKNLRYGEIAVITGDLPVYASYARKVLEGLGIPCFIDEKHSVLMNPFVEYLRSSIEMAVQSYSYESVFRYLRCSLSCLTREEIDCLENYVVALGIRGRKQWEEKWVRIYRGMQPEEIEEMNRLRQMFVEETKALAEGFAGGRKKVGDFARALYEFIIQGSIREKLYEQEKKFALEGRQALEKEYQQIYDIVMKLLEKIVEILGEEEVTRQEFQQLLEAGLTEAQVALIPPSADQVLVGDIERTRLKDVKALFFVGINDGNIPRNTEKGGIFTEMDREFFQKQGIELAPGAREQIAIQRFYLYLNLTRPSRYLYLSYSHANAKGEALSPAYLIGTVQKLFPGLTIEEGRTVHEPEHPKESLPFFLKGLAENITKEEQPIWEELYSWYLNDQRYAPVVRRLVEAAFWKNPQDAISKSVAKALYQEVSPYSATRLEKYSACAFAHFLRYGLELSERAEYEFKAMDMGNVVHKALENFASNIRKRGLSWKELTQKEREELVEESLKAVTADYGNTILHASARNEYMIARVKRILNRTVWALQEQLKRGEFVPEGFEVSFQGGRIDRVDICREEDKVYVKVIDYKTGNTSFDLVAVYHGLQLQLMVYLNGALEEEARKYPQCEVIPAGVFYYNVKDPMIQAAMETDIREVEQKVLKELKMSGLVQAEADTVRKLDATCETLPVAYNKHGSFRKGSSVADSSQFALLSRFVKNKIQKIRDSIMEGEIAAAPYELGKERACTYCPYQGVCGFDQKLEGFDYRRLKKMAQEEVWSCMEREEA